MKFKEMFKRWFHELMEHKYKIFMSLALVCLVSVLTKKAGQYVDEVSGSATHDIILDNIPSIDLSFIFVYVWLAVIFFLFFYPFIFRVNKFHKVIFHFSLINIVRGFFIILTHLKMPADIVPVEFPFPFNKLSFENDLFFSGHTAIPLVGFFVFKGENIRYIFLVMSIIMAITVLFMHQHYSIDVFAAYFIAYGTYHFGEYLLSLIKKKASIFNRK